MPINMTLSNAGAQLMGVREGKRNAAYQDSRGIWTIGIGHTPASEGMLWTDEQVYACFQQDTKKFVDALNASIDVPVTQNMFDALFSFIFNIGITGWLHSSTRRCLNDRHYDLAAKDMLMWEEPPELKLRREGEMKQFLTPDGA